MGDLDHGHSQPDAQTVSVEGAFGSSPTATVDDRTAEPREITVGATVGRYVVLEVIGRGGMGQVLRAYDPKLQREVALKRVHTDAADADARARMLREARAMAQLSHANVVAVYDAEQSPQGVVLVMEYVAGQTLAQWSKDGEHPWRAVVERYLAAGRGLVAAHAQGLLHRDFKPANVLLSEVGEVKVTDFGLAKLGSAARTHRSQPVEGAPSGDSLDGELTHAGTVMGTPRYMAPEQHSGTEQGPAVDQYALCVSLWEGLFGATPFEAERYAEIFALKLAGPPPWPSSSRGVPRRLIAALRRGLAVAPEDRWPSLADLLAELAYDPAARRRRAVASVGGVTVLAGALGAGVLASPDAALPCTGAAERLEGVWDEPRREQVEAAMTALDASYAHNAWQHAQASLDAYADAWVTMHTETCTATTIRGEQSAEAMDLRMACLDRARAELDAVAQVLVDADRSVVRRVHTVVDQLEPLAPCEDVEALRADVAPPPAHEAAAVEASRDRVALARAERAAGRFDHALAHVQAAVQQLEGIDYEPVVAEVELERGMVVVRRGQYEEAEQALRQALAVASRWRRYDLMQACSSSLMHLVGFALERPDEALRYLETAQGLAHGDPQRQASMHSTLAAIRYAQGDYAAAETEDRRALALRLDAFGPDHPEVALAHNNVGIALRAQGKHVESEEQHRQALAIRERSLGPSHPEVASSLNNLAIVLYTQGRYEECEQTHRRALAIFEDTLGPRHATVGKSRANLANTLAVQDHYEGAEVEYRAALDIFLEALGPQHPAIAQLKMNLSDALSGQDQHDEAEQVLREALQLQHETIGDDHPHVAVTRTSLALVLKLQGRDEEAVAQMQQAIAIQEAALGADDPRLAHSRSALAIMRLERGEHAEALALAQKAWTRYQADDIPEEERAENAFVLARALLLVEGEGSRARAVELARRAETDFARIAPRRHEDLEAVRTWLRANG